jgi:hypothetical protein
MLNIPRTIETTKSFLLLFFNFFNHKKTESKNKYIYQNACLYFIMFGSTGKITFQKNIKEKKKIACSNKSLLFHTHTNEI